MWRTPGVRVLKWYFTVNAALPLDQKRKDTAPNKRKNKSCEAKTPAIRRMHVQVLAIIPRRKIIVRIHKSDQPDDRITAQHSQRPITPDIKGHPEELLLGRIPQ